MAGFFHQHKKRILVVFLLICAGSLSVRMLNRYHFHESALLYVGLPTLIAIMLILIRPATDKTNQSSRALGFIVDGLIVFFGSSILLFEGFICVLFALPIYAIVLAIIYVISEGIHLSRQKGRGRLGVQLLPLVLLASAFEGTTPELSIDRQERVSVTRVVPLSVDEIRAKLLRPLDVTAERPWLLSVFPMPYREVKPSLDVGAVHEIHFRYYRWFVANLHEGRIQMQMTHSDEQQIRTRVLDDSSYLANYLRLHGMTIEFEALSDKSTRVSLEIAFERKLDPYWYFGPLERYGVRQMASYLISGVML